MIRRRDINNKYKLKYKIMLASLGETYLQSAIKRLKVYKDLGDKTFAQLEEKDFHFQPNEESNSIAIIIQHISGNMLSRFTNFLTEDGEKEWRNRDAEFNEQQYSKQQLIELWEKGWAIVFQALRSLTENDLLKTIYIRSELLSVIDAINRQLAHYPHHVGQIVYLGKIIKNGQWKSLSIPKGQSETFNKQMTGKK
jgi:Protein of unknown function (DUF1572)